MYGLQIVMKLLVDVHMKRHYGWIEGCEQLASGLEKHTARTLNPDYTVLNISALPPIQDHALFKSPCAVNQAHSCLLSDIVKSFFAWCHACKSGD